MDLEEDRRASHGEVHLDHLGVYFVHQKAYEVEELLLVVGHEANWLVHFQVHFHILEELEVHHEEVSQ